MFVFRLLLTALSVVLLSSPGNAQSPAAAADSLVVRQNYTKLDRQIPMRDGTKLYTVIYVPTDASPANRYPFLMERTPYSAGPYGETNYPKTGPGPSKALSQEKYIFVFQDVRGRYMSEGNFEEMTPSLDRTKPTASVGRGRKSTLKTNVPTATDESTDTYDTIEWLLKNIPNNNGRVGLIGISYPGFYASAALPGAHPALKAVSPQAPVTDEFIGDDARHNGAFFLLDNFSFMNYFDAPRKGPVADYEPMFTWRPKDAYQFFLDLGPIKHANDPQYFNNKAKIWNEYLQHDTYDAYWKSRNIRPHLKATQPGSQLPATLVVGGWYDAEDLFGTLRTYEAIEKQNPGTNNRLVMGPWTHGAWARDDWSLFGPFAFGQNTANYYRDTFETPFFAYHLKGKGSFTAPEAAMFDTGTNEWKSFDAWPPKTTTTQTLFLAPQGQLTTTTPTAGESFDEYVSDPAKPVPYTDGIYARRNNQYMIEDQRFAARRPDVVTFVSEPFADDLVLAGPISANLFVSTTGTDADFIVKIIDVLPDNTPNPAENPKGLTLGGYQRLVRAEVLRGKFRNSLEQPEPFKPGQIAEVRVPLNDALHTFRKGHRLMVQVQHTWFPLVDRNPQKFLDISTANASDFQKATMRLYHDAAHPSKIELTTQNK
ncbi:CocE/NonD family hydrolase [Fibrisoma montanum]|uniref:CocE/NonD family hydrolase n=1 Tax=Fibrisoma montanum TaxID=2305895 RepID=A0A418M9A1_9BACT|nr:CocE/NonD family hydrolase [Fibrisoma montanum]RIV22679.1 CocE/NonD family hydrolase [Fibrisoma montanum]